MTRAARRIERRYEHDLACLPPGVPRAPLLLQTLQALQDKGYADLSDRLRVLRQLVFHRLCVLDCAQEATLDDVMFAMTELAEVCITQATQKARTDLAVLYGLPRKDDGQMARLWVVGMGKLGARELNVSSDIDLIYVYDADGQTDGAKSISNHEFFTHQVRRVQTLLGDVTAHGFVFRVDLALRPYGREGALAVSLASLSQYFLRVGREWERFAWLKSRVLYTDGLAPEMPAAAVRQAVLPLRSVVRSFVFRRFLDHPVFVALQQLHQLIRDNADPVHGDRDVKLGRGGIREIEFAAQVLQIVRGGRQPELLARPTLLSLTRLHAAGLMDEQTVQSLSEAYVFLRRVEHHIQYLDDQQTHRLPTDADDLAWIAQSMGFRSVSVFEWTLAQHREAVAVIFEHWVHQRPLQTTGQETALQDLTVASIQTKAKWTIQYLRKHPDVADELKRPDILHTRFDREQFVRTVQARYQALQATGLCDDEAVLDLLRRAHHAEVFRTLVRDVQGVLSVRDVGDDLSALADSLIGLTLQWCWERLPKRHRERPKLAVIAYGKLGGKELGYGSDLDIVFLYDDEDDSAPSLYANLVRKLITWLTVKTGEGDLYEIDTALRPNGNSGLLVTHIDAYERYQLQRGSNTAWTWELQAMTRARCIDGDASMHDRFDAIRAKALCAVREPNILRQEIATMREKLRQAHPPEVGQFDIKHGVGGMIDAEFAVQCLILTHAQSQSQLLENLGNIALLKIAQAQHLLPDEVGLQAADAYQVLRDKQHAARLQEVKAQLPDDQLLAERAAIVKLWQAVFEA